MYCYVGSTINRNIFLSFPHYFAHSICTYCDIRSHVHLPYNKAKLFFQLFLTQSFSSSVPYNNVAVSAESSEREGDEASVVSSSPNSRPRSSVRVLQTNLFSRAHAFQTFLHLISLTLSYFLMLIAMTFNSWLFGSVVGGLAAG